MSGAFSPAGCPAGSALVCSRRHWSVYWLLIVLAVIPAGWRAASAGRGQPEDWPMFSANDRSRWCQAAALVDHGQWEIDSVIASGKGRKWDTIDKVRHRGPDGRLHDYSSKPPLLATIVAGEYWLLRQLTGWHLTTDPAPVVRTILTVNHTLCLLLLMALLASLLEPMLVADWTRYFIVAAAGWGTFLGSFVVTLNNHLPAAACAMAVIWSVDRIIRHGRQATWWVYAVGGLAGGMTMALELPAAVLLALAGLVAFFVSPVRFIVAFLPAAALPLGALLWTTQLCHGTWRLPYSFRGDGPVIAVLDGDLGSDLEKGAVPERLAEALRPLAARSGLATPAAWLVEAGKWPGDLSESGRVRRWAVRDMEGDGWATVHPVEGNSWEVRQWGNWYDYPGSYWRTDNSRRAAVVQGEPDPVRYGFHLMVGHHGVLSLTPLWLLAFAGLLPLAVGRRLQRRVLGCVVLATTAVVLWFYLSRDVTERNYGGMTCCARWLLWLAPLWLVAMAPVVQMLARWRAGRWVCLVLLGGSLLSAMAAWDNPWVHPWLQRWIDW